MIANDIIYKCITLATFFPNKIYWRTAQREFEKWFYKHNNSFKKKFNRNDTTLAKYVWDLKLKHNVIPTLKCYILKFLAPYSNITKKCRLYLQEKLEILSHPNPDEPLHKRSKLVSKCHHMNKFLLANYKNYKVSDWYNTYCYHLAITTIL